MLRAPLRCRLKSRIAQRLGLRPELARLSMGRHSYGEPTVITHEGDTANVVVGSFTSIAADVLLIVGGSHRTDWISTFPFRAVFGLPGAFADGHPAPSRDMVIGNDIWIGRCATILPGVHVGNGAVIAACSVVTKDVRPYAIVAGNPAREVRRRFSDEQIAALERLCWWDWPLPTILASVPVLCSDDVDALLEQSEIPASQTVAEGLRPGVTL